MRCSVCSRCLPDWEAICEDSAREARHREPNQACAFTVNRGQFMRFAEAAASGQRPIPATTSAATPAALTAASTAAARGQLRRE